MEESFIDSLLTFLGQKFCFYYIRRLKSMLKPVSYIHDVLQMLPPFSAQPQYRYLVIRTQSGAPLHKRLCSGFPCPTEDLHHQRNCGHRRRQQEQLSGTFCHHHQCEEPASAVGEGELHRGHPRKHRPRHSCCGTSKRNCFEHPTGHYHVQANPQSCYHSLC